MRKGLAIMGVALGALAFGDTAEAQGTPNCDGFSDMASGTGSVSSSSITAEGGDMISGSVSGGTPTEYVIVWFLADFQDGFFDASGNFAYSFDVPGDTGDIVSGSIDVFTTGSDSLTLNTSCTEGTGGGGGEDPPSSGGTGGYSVQVHGAGGGRQQETLDTAPPHTYQLSGSSLSLLGQTELTGNLGDGADASKSASAPVDGLSFTLAGDETDAGLRFWTRGTFALTRDTRAATESDGWYGSGTVGLSYAATESLRFGGSLTLTKGELTFDADETSYQSDMMTVSAFASYISLLGLEYSVYGAVSSSDVEIETPGITPVTGDYTADTFAMGLSVGGQFALPPKTQGVERRFAPVLALEYARDESDPFTLSDSTDVAATSSELGRLRFSPRLMARHSSEAPGVAYVDTSFGLNGIWQFHQDNSVGADGDTGLSAGLTGSVRYVFDNGGQLQLGGAISGLGSDRQTASASVSYAITFD